MNYITGRSKEKNYLFRIFDQAKDGRGQTILVAGEAGVGKTALVEETLLRSGLKYYTARCNNASSIPYGPIVTILRNCLSESEDRTIDCGGLTKYLPLVLPELGEPLIETDAETLKEAIISALFTLAKYPTVFFIDDIQWIDEATVDLLISLSEKISSKSIVVTCTYSSNDISRVHHIKKFRNELRRRRILNELSIEPLNFDETSSLINTILDAEADEDLTRKIYNSTQGVPLFIEEIVNSLVEQYLLKVTSEKIYLADNAEITVPENLKDTILHQLQNISEAARKKLEVASVVGLDFDPSLIIKLTGNEEGFDELFDRRLITEFNSNLFSFRHFVIYEVFKNQVSWSRKKTLHKHIAEYLEKNGADPEIVAYNWASANEYERAISKFIEAFDRAFNVHAYNDAIKSAHRAIELWKDNSKPEKKYALLIKLAHCYYITSRLDESVNTLKEIIESVSDVNIKTKAEAYRMLATIYSLMRMSDLSSSARIKAAELFEESGLIQESASELIILSGKYTAQLNLSAALECVNQASEKALSAGMLEIDAEARGLKGYILAMQGKFAEGRKIAQEALTDALKLNLNDAASIIYKRLAGTFEYASDYSSAREAYYNAYNFCLREGQDVNAQICLGCMSYTLFQTGEWKKSLEICDETIKNKNTPEASVSVAHATKGVILALRGEIKSAQKNLHRSIELAVKHDALANQMFAAWGLAILSEYSSDIQRTIQSYIDVIKIWEKTQDKHDIILFLVWAGYFFSENSLRNELNVCTQSLNNIAASTGNYEALTALAFILGENAALDKNFSAAIEHYNTALDYVEKLTIPLLQMLINFRIGIAYSNINDSFNAQKFLFSAQSISKNLATRPFTTRIEEAFIHAGISPSEKRKNDSDTRNASAGLTRRQLEILEQVVQGLTNKEIADKLFLSTRTVDMHVSHILERLNCRTRIDAINKAREMKII